jgi:hypothetical protein
MAENNEPRRHNVTQVYFIVFFVPWWFHYFLLPFAFLQLKWTCQQFSGRRCIIISANCFRVFFTSLLVGTLLLSGVANASYGVVEKVTVNIVSNQTPPARIAKRMAASVATVGEQMLVGRSVSEVESGRASYEKLIKEIFDRVLVGYSVQSVALVPDSNAMLTIEIAPWGDVVHEASLELDFGNLSPEVVTLIKKDMGNIGEKVNDVLVGLPIDAVDWAGGVSKIVIRELLAEQLPEFRANIEIIPGARTVVKLSLSPIGQIVQDVHVSLRSHTIPNVLLASVRPILDDTSKTLTGLPVAFLERHRDYFTAKLTASAAERPMAKEYGLMITPVLNPGVDTEMALMVETDKYNITLEGYLDMGGRTQDNTSVRLHAGKIIGKRDEVFMEVNFIPSTVAWEFTPGWGHAIGSSTTAGIKYSLSEKRDVLWLHQEISRNWMVRLERTPENGRNEFALRYKLHDFLSAEYVFRKENKWLRLIGSL